MLTSKPSYYSPHIYGDITDFFFLLSYKENYSLLLGGGWGVGKRIYQEAGKNGLN